MPNTHKRLAASAAHRWLACPGSIRLAEEHGLESKPSKYAQEGTAAHALAEKALKEEKPAAHYVGQEIEGWAVTEEMAEAVQRYLDFVDATSVGDTTVKIEKNVDVGDTGGTCDCLVYRPERKNLLVVDYKHGRGLVVDPERNPQLMVYALGALRLFPETESVRVVIVQPRAGGEPVREWWTSPKDLADWQADVLRPGMAAVDAPEMRFAAGDHCRFCPAAGVCRAAVNAACEVAKVEFGLEPSFPEAAALTPEELGKALSFATRLSAWIDALKASAQERAERGQRVPGWKLVEGRSRREWTEGAAEHVEEMLGDDAYEKKLLTPAKAEKVLKRKGLDKSALAEHVIKPLGQPTLVPQSDKREEIVVDAASEFVESLDMFS
ncbi:MAG: DUF2800 domain-containing protein [Anaerolineales bacterium]